MDKYELFKQSAENIAKQFLELPKRPVRIISHLDSDGLAAASILIKAFKRQKIKFSTSIVKQLNENILKEIAEENYKYFFFTDLGSGYLSLIKKILSDKTIFVLDHHKPEDVKVNFAHLNPHLQDIDGSTEISGAGVVYLFCKALNPENKDMAHIAIVGAIGDVQENKGFQKLNDDILQDAIELNKIEIKTGLRMFGMQTKPLHKVLENSTELYIPGITGNESGALKFLVDVGINPKVGNKWKKLVNLDEEDMKKLVTGIILKRLGSEKMPEDVLGPIYLLKEEEEENPTKDAKEFSTLLNACGRLAKFSYGIGACLGNNAFRKKAIDVLGEYKKEIIDSLTWFYKAKKDMKTGENYVIINCGDNVKDTLVGILASMVAKSDLYNEGTIIIAMSNTIDDNIKISIRRAGSRSKEDFDLRAILQNITKSISGSICGGHKFAAGSLIAQDKEEQFIESAEKVLKNLIIEENVK